MSVPIPETLRLQAVNVLRLPAEAVNDAWAKHCAWVDEKHPGGTYGGLPWQKYVRELAAELKALEEGKTRDELREANRAKNAKRAAEAKAKADAEYAKFAVSFTDYVESLREELFDEGLDLPPHEDTLARSRVPYGTEGLRALAFLDRLFFSPPGARTTSRISKCACGRDVASWSRDGFVYRGTRCRPCAETEQRDRRVAKGELPSKPQWEVPR